MASVTILRETLRVFVIYLPYLILPYLVIKKNAVPNNRGLRY